MSIELKNNLAKELELYCKENHLPHLSCDELLAELQNKYTDLDMKIRDLKKEMQYLEKHMDWCIGYIERWDNEILVQNQAKLNKKDLKDISFLTFKNNKIRVIRERAAYILGLDVDENFTADYVIIYPGGLYIEDYGKDNYVHEVQYTSENVTKVHAVIGRYYMILERDDWITDDLEDLEKKLYKYGQEAGTFE